MNHTVRVTVRSDGIGYSHGLVVLRSEGDQVRWRCRQGQFTVSFREDTPFGKMTLHSKKVGDEFEIGYQKPHDDVRRGGYHYSVAVAVEQREERRQHIKVAVDSGCPEVRIEF